VQRQRVRRRLIAISAALFPVTFFYLSPYLIIMAAGERIICGAFIVFGALFAASLVLGRAFCGWICPVGGIADASARMRNKRIRRPWLDWIKIAYWPMWLGVIVYVSARAGGFGRIDFLYQTWHGISVSNLSSALLAIVIVGVVAVLTITMGRRAFCHTLCWIAPFMILGTWLRDRLRLPGLRLTATPETCIACRACTRACPMSLDVQQSMVGKNRMRHRECALCGSCADTCPTRTISLRFGSGTSRANDRLG